MTAAQDGVPPVNLHAQPLGMQPLLDEYIGSYDRSPDGSATVRADDGSLAVTSGRDQFGLIFYSPDMAYSISDGGSASYRGMPIEFIRDARAEVCWMRVDGRIAKKVELH